MDDVKCFESVNFEASLTSQPFEKRLELVWLTRQFNAEDISQLSNLDVEEAYFYPLAAVLGPEIRDNSVQLDSFRKIHN